MEELKEETVANRGVILKKAREEKGLSLEIVHEATKIPMDVLKAIEEGYTTRSMSPFYYRGFLKIYANYLNVDHSLVIDEIKDERLKFKKVKQEYEPFDMQEFLSQFLTRERKQQIIIAIGIFLALFIAFKAVSWIVQHKPKARIPKPKAAVSVKKKVSKQEQPAAVIPQKATFDIQKTDIESAEAMEDYSVGEVADADEGMVEPIAVAKDVTLTIRTRKGSWLRVKADDKVVFQGSLKSGAVETWNASKQIEISGKNIQNLEFELNGKTIGSLGSGGSKAKAVVVTSEGLSVTK
jgi:cytoskeletal protein RodZ